MNPQYTNVKVEGPSFPTKGQPVFWGVFLLPTKKIPGPLYVSAQHHFPWDSPMPRL